MLKINEKRIVGRVTEWISKKFKKAHFNRAVIGLSGGVDSAVVAFLAVKALGKDNVICVKLPYRSSSKDSLTDADKIIDILKVPSKKIDITPLVESFSESLENTDPERLGNIMARVRMTVLFDIAAANDALVLGTSNKTERYLGYGTLFGDLASIINPIGNFYKSQIWDIAKYLGVPENVINKNPSADLIEGQTDEMDFGFTYQMADDILDSIFEEKKSKIETTNLHYTLEEIDEVLSKVENNKFKGEIPYIFDPRAF